ncbi:tetratricopeptide repeat protein [Aquimarina mytili]|uniref:Tetratricopeptide repeat protein n=1 Tax=Aquimarina mytili TaxID=874423 RepID=A0A936ZUL2_9FLAO|nr:tetratricopeptide repeat protein [Aquimarina mytili]MBL0682193.1 tetratricopeptide repeat protein [Aquimarina mytili]
MGLFSFLFGKKKMTLEQANQKNQEYVAQNPEPKNDENAMMRQASIMLTSGKFEEAIELYKKLAENYPENKGLYLSQVGAAWYFLNDFQKAIQYYKEARENGANESMMDDNIWEASEAIYKNNNDKNAIEKYLEYYPDGSYVKKAKKILSN